ncbi:uncharacterized protein LOC142975557 isoform X2 [Anticarsia gemmatalis]|uniref:uncharacterized protein LOC142975557 isoform X2 n=1 Tax=Anticarsia gemmatalis TaxID=129554 RepID=UPI003F75DEDE
MNLKDLDLAKLSKLTSEHIDELKCLECCKYFIAPATAACGHTLCHTCWRGRRTCPACSSSFDRKLLKLNLPLQQLTNHVQTLGEAFEKLFNIKLEEFNLDTPEELESEKDPVKNVKDWLTSSQNHFSAPIQNSEPFSQESQVVPANPLEVSSSNIIIHTDTKKVGSPVKAAKVVHVTPPQDDWDKIETMPDVEDKPKNNENIVGPMDIEPFFVEDTEYTTDNPRRSSRKRDTKHDDDSIQKAHDFSSNKHNSRDSSCETDKKSLKGKQTWHNVKRMRKEFSKLNKKNRNKLNVSIEMVKKTQNVKPISSTPVVASQQAINIDDNTPNDTDKENEMVFISPNNPNKENKESNSDDKLKEISPIQVEPVEPNPKNVSTTNYASVENKNNNKIDNSTKLFTTNSAKEPDNLNKSQKSTKGTANMSFIKKSALCPQNIEVTCGDVNKVVEQQTGSGNADDIEISIKIGSTITNILIKKKNDIQVKINTDREVQTSLGPHHLVQNEPKGNEHHNIDINIDNAGNKDPESQINISKSGKTQATVVKVNQSASGKKNTASADTATAQFEITESVEKELSNIMEYETAGDQEDTPKKTNVDRVQNVDQVQQVNENVEHLDDLNDLDIFNSGSVKEANVQLLKDHAPSEILTSTVCSKLKTQRNAEKRNRENADEEILPKNKKVKVTSQQKANQSLLPDSEPNYDVIMGQVFANIDADFEEIRKSQNTQNVKATQSDKNKEVPLKNRTLSGLQKTQIIKRTNESCSQVPNTNIQEYFNEKHSENVFSIMEKEDETAEVTKTDHMPQTIVELLTPVQCRNVDTSQESQDDLPKTNKSNKKSQDYDDSGSVVEETPQKNVSIPKLKRASTTNLSQTSFSETKKIPMKVSAQNSKSIINLTDTVTDKSSRDVTMIENAGKKLTLETPLTITKFADHIIHKSTPVARKSLNFDHENEDDAEQTLCPTSEIVAKTTQEKEIMSKAFERTPTTPAARPLMARNIAAKTNRKFCLAASCLTSSEIINVKHLCAQFKWSFSEKYTDDITHLVVGVDEEWKSQRSVKYMCALAASKWIVSFDWIKSCLLTKAIVNEEKFEALDSTGEPGPRRSRTAKHKLFQGIKFYCMQPFSVLDGNTLKSMLVAAGGHVVKEMKEVRVSNDSAEPALLLAEPEHTQEDRFIYLAMEQSIVPVNYEWVLNCLGSYALGSIQELLLCPSSLLPSATAKWPHVLLAQDYD